MAKTPASGTSLKARCWVAARRHAPAAASSAAGGHGFGWRWLLVGMVACLLAASCTSRPREQPAPTSRPAGVPAQRDYWPTAGWRTAPPAQAGMDPKTLADLDTNVAYHPQLRSLLVIRHGYLVYERYWHGDASTGQAAFSVTKSFTGALVGIALRDHELKSLHQTVGELLAAHLPPNADPRLAKVTVGQLLTMTAGLAADDRYPGDPDLTYRLRQSRDWVRHILGRKPVTRPGTTFAYSNAGSHLLSAIVADTTGRSTLAFARAKLFGPLGIRTEHAFQPVEAAAFPTPAEERAYQRAVVAWPTDPQGYHIGFGGLKLPARDLAKLGYLYLNGGRWDGVQVVPTAYVRASTQPQSHPPASAGLRGYGYQWWVTSEHGHPSFVAVGYGGQFVQVIPDLDLVVVITSDAENGRDDAQQLVGEAIIPASTG